jgi:hypothetical protein
VNGGDVVVIDRTESREQHWDALGAAGILVPPRAVRMVAQQGAGEVVGQIKRARPQVLLRCRSTRVCRFVPQRLSALDTE